MTTIDDKTTACTDDMSPQEWLDYLLSLPWHAEERFRYLKDARNETARTVPARIMDVRERPKREFTRNQPREFVYLVVVAGYGEWIMSEYLHSDQDEPSYNPGDTIHVIPDMSFIIAPSN